jgi:hypothetical protein
MTPAARAIWIGAGVPIWYEVGGSLGLRSSLSGSGIGVTRITEKTAEAGRM